TGTLTNAAGGVIDVLAGAREGARTLSGNQIDNAGTINVSGADLSCTLSGTNPTFTSTSTIAITVDYKVQIRGGTATLAGTLEASLKTGLDPAADTTFDVITMTSGTMTGMFNPLILPPLAGDRHFEITYPPNKVALVVRTGPNPAPMIANIPDATILEGAAYIGPPPMLLQGNPPITWSLVAGPEGMTINTVTGVVTWPGPTTSGSPFTITIRAANDVGSGDETWILTVTVPAPIIADIPNASVLEGTAYTGPTPTATQGAPPITWSLVNGPAGMTIDSSTGVVSWPSPTVAGSPHTITIRAANAVGDDEESWQLTVISKAPQIAAIADATIQAGVAYTGPTPTLITGAPPVTWSLAAGPAGMTIDPATGVVSWPDPAVDGSPHGVTIRATNDYGSDDETWRLTVMVPPVIAEIPDGSVQEGQHYTGPTPALSPGGGPAQWTLVTAPPGMGIDGNGVVSWWAVLEGSPHTITIRASNPFGEDEETWHLTVELGSPVIQGLADDTFAEGQPYIGPAPILTRGNRDVEWSLAAGPAGMTIDPATGVVRWPDPTIVGSPHTITIRAANPVGQSDATWRLVVVVEPVISQIPDAAVDVGTPYTGPTPVLTPPTLVTWLIVEGPPDMSIDGNGVVHWPNPTLEGSPHAITIRAANVAGQHEVTWHLTVRPIAPVIAALGDDYLVDGQPYSRSAPALLKGTPPVTWSLVEAPAGMTIDPDTGAVTWPVAQAAGAPHTVTIRATNAVGSDDGTWRIGLLVPPVILEIPDGTAIEGQAYTGPLPALAQPTRATWSLIAGPPGMSISAATGRVSWPTVTGQDSPFTITIQAENELGDDQESWTLTAVSPPVIADIPDATINEGVAYTGPVPVLLGGSQPVTWSLVAGPEGMTIDSATGVVSWPAPVGSDAPYVVTIRATNAAGSDTESWQLLVPVSYTAVVAADVNIAPAGTPVNLTGIATYLDTGLPAPNVPVTIRIRVKGTRRLIETATDETGAFTTVFQPLPGEAGRYVVGAEHPSVALDPQQDEFLLVGMRITPKSGSYRLAPGTPLSVPMELRNLGDTLLTGVGVAVEGAAANLSVQFPAPGTLDPMAVLPINLELSAGDASVQHHDVKLVLTSNEGALAEATLHVQVVPLVPQLAATPASIRVGMVRGMQTVTQFELTNTGGAPTGTLDVLIPSDPWISLGSPPSMGPLNPGETAAVILRLSPGTDLPLGLYQGSLWIGQQDGTGVSVPFEFHAISDALGDLKVIAEDEYTFFADGAPRVAGARVVLTDILNATIAEGVTGENGEILFQDLREGTYVLELSADRHDPDRGPVTVKPGTTEEIFAFLPRQLVTYSWMVVPTEIQDRYRITVEAVFETYVPAPVVTVDPALATIPADVDEAQVVYTFTNHGWIAAQDFRLVLPTHPRYDVLPLVDAVDEIPARTSIQVPILFRKKSTAAQGALGQPVLASTESCGGGHEGLIALAAHYDYICGANIERTVNMTVIGYAIDALHLRNLEGIILTAWCAFADLTGYGRTWGHSGMGRWSRGTRTPRRVFSGGEGSAGYGGFDCTPPDFGSLPMNDSTADAASADAHADAGESPPVNKGQPELQEEPQPAGVCARVRIRIEQDAVLTRTAFLGTLEIENTQPDIGLENVRVILQITDPNSSPMDDRFAVIGPELTGISDVDGGGVIPPSASASARWTFIPTHDAAPEGPTRYLIGGELSYTENGTLVTVPLLPDLVTVYPEARLDLKYFLERDVYSDDPFTDDVVEPAVPYSLGLMVTNYGRGQARNLTITSSQPEIIENEKGLLMDFQIIGTRVGTDAVMPSLTVNLGDVDPGKSAVAQWIMTASLQGRFCHYEASFEHIDGLGDPRLSLIDSATIFEMLHAVRMDAPGDLGLPDDDGLPDFLVIREAPPPQPGSNCTVEDNDDAPTAIHSSEGPILPVNAILDGTIDGAPSESDLEVELTAIVPGGWVYLRVDDPAANQFRLKQVIRSDGREIRVGDNAWQTHRVIRLEGQPPRPQDRLHLVDKDSTGSYRLIYAPPLDSDSDGVPDRRDNCPNHYNSDQADCDGDGKGNVCAIAEGVSQDCNLNGIPDSCDMAAGTSKDCNANGVPDECDIANGTSRDLDHDSVPDECDLCPNTISGAPVDEHGCSPLMARKIFYNNSYFDGNKPGIDPAPIAGPNNDDSDAIDPGKEPLIPGYGMATSANWTGFAQGINGLIYDVKDPSRAPVVGDFLFRTIGKAGTSPPVVVAPSAFAVLPGAGVNGSDRVVITFSSWQTGGAPGGTWPYGSVQNTWLQVDIGTGFGLPAPDTHYWGNAAGDTGQGNIPPNILVNPTDEIWIRTHPTTPLNRSPVQDMADVNKDSLANPTDQVYIRTHATTPLNCVRMVVR
ncbi:MAG: carboxypeptidase regulatory-like domain-containing protein, partial [Planctomycetes bacterium]|nr:carboxypeptidase regulatory-like domain-containing protein [Planctomycetota bacterium]